MTFWQALKFGKGGTRVFIVGVFIVLIYAVARFSVGATEVHDRQVQYASAAYDACEAIEREKYREKGWYGFDDKPCWAEWRKAHEEQRQSYGHLPGLYFWEALTVGGVLWFLAYFLTAVIRWIVSGFRMAQR
jgi:hypothetical protein